MLVQPMTNQYSYRNYQQQKNNQHTSFKSERGEKVLKEIVSSGVSDSAGIGKVLQKMGIGFMGLVSLSTLRDILGEVFKKKAEYEKSLDSQKQAFKEEKQAFEKEKVAKLEELRLKEKDLIKTKHILRDGEIDVIKSSLRVLYGVHEPDIQSYDSLGEQTSKVIDIINNQKNINVSNYNSNTVNELVIALQNNDKKINSDTLNVLEKITAMRDYDMKELISVIGTLKDDFGDIDINRSAHFIALYSLDNAGMKSVAQEMIKFYQNTKTKKIILSDEEFMNYVHKLSNTYYFCARLLYAQKLSECDTSCLRIDTKADALNEIARNAVQLDQTYNPNEYGIQLRKIYQDLIKQLSSD